MSAEPIPGYDDLIESVHAQMLASTPDDLRDAAPRPVTLADVRNGRALLTVDETAQVLDVSPHIVRRAIARGDLPARRLGRGIRVPGPALLAWLGAEA